MESQKSVTMTASPLVDLARQVLDNTTKYEEYFASQGLPAPSLDAGSFPGPKLPEEILAARDTVVVAGTKLRDIVRGPQEVLQQNLLLVRFPVLSITSQLNLS